MLKVLLKIIHNRIFRKCEEDMDDTQFGFRSGLSTREALFSLNVLVQRCLDVNVDVYMCFIDYEKAFDTVRHPKLLELLQEKGIDARDIQLIANLYWNQTANIKIENEISGEVKIRRGVRQGCILSPLLFNMYSEAIFKEALQGESVGIMVNGKHINNIRYADDTVLIADSLKSLHQLVEKVNEVSNSYGLKMNLKKTKLLLVSKTATPDTNTNFVINSEPIERVTHYKYLGTWVNEKWDQSQEIKTRIEIARSAFLKMRRLLSNRDLNLGLRRATCYVLCALNSFLWYESMGAKPRDVTET
jgi:hypothetical protein